MKGVTVRCPIARRSCAARAHGPGGDRMALALELKLASRLEPGEVFRWRAG